MLFRRRHRPSRIERLRVAVWPRHSWARSSQYIGKRVLRLTASPHVIALGFAAGAFASFTPLIGFHFLMSFAIAFLIRGNMVAAALGTAIGNPLTFPFIWASTFSVGQWILYGRAPETVSDQVHQQLQSSLFEASFDRIWPTIKPMLVGAIPIGLVVAINSYFIVLKSVELFQHRRRLRLERKNQTLMATAQSTVKEESSI